MKLGSQALVIALVMALAAVPAAFAGNGHGGGKPSWAGQGKPPWAGQGKPSSVGQGKPSWAGQGHAAHPDKATKPKKDKHHEQAGSSEDGGTQSASPDLEGRNPAQYCRALQDEMSQLAAAFAEMFGTNPNHANAFGKCVSRRAHGEDLSGASGGDEQGLQDDSCETTESPDASSSSTGEGAQDGGSDDQATDAGSCGNDASASDGPAGDEQDQGDDGQGEEDQGQNGDGGTAGEGDSSDLADALRFLRL